MSEQLKEAVTFFRSEAVYRDLFKAFRKKYESLGRIGGTVSLRSFTDEEIAQIGAFFGLPGERMKEKGSVSLRGFEEQLAYTKFQAIPLKELLDAFYGETIRSNKEQQAIKEATLRRFFTDLRATFPDIAFWLTFLEAQRSEGRWIVQIAEKTPELFENYVAILHQAWKEKPTEAERLPMFSQRISGDPHALDMQTDVGRMWLHVLAVHQYEEGNTPSLAVPSSTEAINALLQTYYIYRDDLLNFVTCANLLGETTKGTHPVWEAAVKEQTVQIVPLRELVSLIHARPVAGNIVWVVENSGVCATLLDYQRNAPMICTNGQFTLASWMLIDLLVQDGNVIYYAGDFDPEGLGMAQRLIDRYGEALQLWQMDETAYKKSLSTIELSQERMEKLNHITDERLLAVAEKMRQFGKAGYQEALVTEMVKDIEKTGSHTKSR